MLFLSHTPAWPLSEFVDNLWFCADSPAHPRERILPSGTIEIVVNLCDDEIRIYDPQHPDCCRKYSGAVVSGPYSRSFVIDPQQHASIAGVHFKPGGGFPFLGVLANELTDMHLDLKLLWGSQAIEFRDRLCQAPTPRKRFHLMEKALAFHLHRSTARHPAVSISLCEFRKVGGVPSVHEVARQVNLSQRRFIEVFSSEVGLTPKLFCRVQRFQQLRALASKTASPDWAQLAADCGYFDQSHMIHEFVTFSGLRPGDYLRQHSDRTLRNHVPIVE